MSETPRPRVLVVDDEPTISSTIALILNMHGFDATAFTNPLKAIESLEKVSPDVLISDVSMPEMNGIDLAIKFHSACPSCKILLFSGHASTVGLLEDAKNRGYKFQILAKPIHPRDLLQTIGRL